MSENPISTAKSRLIFSTRSYPTFGRTRKPFDETNPPKTVTDSPYYWWYMFLKLNDDYKKTCSKNGDGIFKDLYSDLGDIHKLNFKEWWIAKAYLFAEVKKGYSMTIATNPNETAPFDDKEVLNLVVPLTWSRRSLKKSFTSLVLNKIEKGKKGVSVEKSDAKYRLSGKWNIEALASAYKIYTIKKQSEHDGIKKYWADIAIEAKLPMSYALKEGHKKFNSDIRRTLTILAKRHYSRAEKYLANSTTTAFP
ncbi:MAG: hypothetical protein KGI88_08105 [Betaproteobacteria bacterium]|nr:hypothetical protein [Betaproteobacteria bacterium]